MTVVLQWGFGSGRSDLEIIPTAPIISNQSQVNGSCIGRKSAGMTKPRRTRGPISAEPDSQLRGSWRQLLRDRGGALPACFAAVSWSTCYGGQGLGIREQSNRFPVVREAERARSPERGVNSCNEILERGHYLRCRQHGRGSAGPERDRGWTLWGRRWRRWKGGRSRSAGSPAGWPASCSSTAGLDSAAGCSLLQRDCWSLAVAQHLHRAHHAGNEISYQLEWQPSGTTIQSNTERMKTVFFFLQKTGCITSDQRAVAAALRLLGPMENRQ